MEIKVQDIVRLASWKDVNIQALRESSRRSHRALHKVVQTFRTGLQADSFLFFQDQLRLKTPEVVPDTSISISISFASWPESIQLPPSLVNISTTFAKFRDVALQVRSARALSNYNLVDALTETIMETSRSLRNAREQEKGRDQQHRSNLLNQKRRALAEFLKEFKRIGLSPNPPGFVLKAQEKPLLLHSSGPVANEEGQFYLLLNFLPRLRQTKADHHEDIPTSQLTRALGSLESLLRLICKLRVVLSPLSAEIELLRRRVSKLQTASLGGFVNPTNEGMLNSTHRGRKVICLVNELYSGQFLSPEWCYCRFAGIGGSCFHFSEPSTWSAYRQWWTRMQPLCQSSSPRSKKP